MIDGRVKAEDARPWVPVVATVGDGMESYASMVVRMLVAVGLRADGRYPDYVNDACAAVDIPDDAPSPGWVLRVVDADRHGLPDRYDYRVVLVVPGDVPAVERDTATIGDAVGTAVDGRTRALRARSALASVMASFARRGAAVTVVSAAQLDLHPATCARHIARRMAIPATRENIMKMAAVTVQPEEVMLEVAVPVPKPIPGCRLRASEPVELFV